MALIKKGDADYKLYQPQIKTLKSEELLKRAFDDLITELRGYDMQQGSVLSREFEGFKHNDKNKYSRIDPEELRVSIEAMKAALKEASKFAR